MNNSISTHRKPCRLFVSSHNISVPKGVLFYPCSCSDTYNSIILFIDCISEFHFVDNTSLSNYQN